jgi:hypothetical protein
VPFSGIIQLCFRFSASQQPLCTLSPSQRYVPWNLVHADTYILSLCLWRDVGYVSARPPPRNTLSELLANAIKSFVNLHSVQFTPITYHEDLFAPSLPLLQSTHPLTNLTVNASCSNEARAPTLVQITGLHSLTLLNPGRAILQLLPEWLERLSSTLRELHLKVRKDLRHDLRYVTDVQILMRPIDLLLM